MCTCVYVCVRALGLHSILFMLPNLFSSTFLSSPLLSPPPLSSPALSSPLTPTTSYSDTSIREELGVTTKDESSSFFLFRVVYSRQCCRVHFYSLYYTYYPCHPSYYSYPSISYPSCPSCYSHFSPCCI